MATYTPIESIVVTSSVSSVTFSNIPQGYTDLVLSTTLTSTTGDTLYLRFNGDTSTSTSYSQTRLYGGASTGFTQRMSGVSYHDVNIGGTDVIGGSTAFYHIFNYSNSTTFKPCQVRITNPTLYLSNMSTLWSNTSPITSITIVQSGVGALITAGSTFDLYGIKAGAVKAEGGDFITTDGTYYYHVFKSTGKFIPRQTLTCDYLVVAGGGGGGSNTTPSGGVGGGGGGGGGLRSTVTATGGGGTLETAISVSAQEYVVTVGAGGAGGLVDSGTGYRGTNGNNSIFSTITSAGGGGGGAVDTGGAGNQGGKTGGSGGGSYFNIAGGSGTSGQGYAGGAGSTGLTYNAGGGGGAGAVGANANGSTPNGGAGVAISSLASATGTGVSNYYAGGGGGGAYIGNAGAGGAGGGGVGRANAAGHGGAGTANTGGGGGGAGYTALSTFGGAGGSGIVIVRYAV